MNFRMSVYLLMSLATCSGARWATADEVSSARDLHATIVLNGQPCDQVIDVKRTADSDYLATCKDGNRYHVFVNAQGRVVVQKQ
jgi:hypothetical protein